MLNERFTGSIPDEMPEFDGDTEGDHQDYEEAVKLHKKMRMLVADNHRRQQELHEKYHIGLDNSSVFEHRLNLLTDMFVGVLSKERLEFELRWQQLISSSLEEMAAQIQESLRKKKSAKVLHLPGGQKHEVIPIRKEEDNDKSNGPE